MITEIKGKCSKYILDEDGNLKIEDDVITWAKWFEKKPTAQLLKIKSVIFVSALFFWD